MPTGRYKSRTMRRVFTRTPGGRVALHYSLRKPKKAHCAGCGHLLQAVPNERPAKLAKLPKSKRRPERPYGGVLCTKCMRAMFRERAREL